MADTPTIIVHEEPAPTVVVHEEPTPEIVIATQGLPGPVGATGPIGPAGTIFQGPDPPLDPAEGDLWLDTDEDTGLAGYPQLPDPNSMPYNTLLLMKLQQNPAPVAAANATFGASTESGPGMTYTGGTFTITFDGDTTTALDWNADSGPLTAALQALPSIGAENASADNVQLGGQISFQNALGAQPIAIERLAFDSTNLTGPDAPYVLIPWVAVAGHPAVEGGPKYWTWVRD